MNQQTARHLLNRLRRLQDTTHRGKPFVLPEGSVSRLDLVERRLIAAIGRDETGSADRDGYPSGRPGSGGDDAGTSTETAAISNLEGDQPDEHHDLTVAAARHLENAVNAIASLLATLDSIDKKSAVSSHANPGGTCAACLRHVEGTADDRIRAGYCEADYRAWLRAGRPDRVRFEYDRRAETAA